MAENGSTSPAEQIMDTYWDLFTEEQIDLEAFCTRLAAGEFGNYEPDDIEEFLREVELNILRNIETMLEANPQLAPLRDERVEETREMIDGLVKKYGRRP